MSIEGLQDTTWKCQLLLAEELSPLELRKILLNCLCLSRRWWYIKSHSMTVLVIHDILWFCLY